MMTHRKEERLLSSYRYNNNSLNACAAVVKRTVTERNKTRTTMRISYLDGLNEDAVSTCGTLNPTSPSSLAPSCLLSSTRNRST